MKKITLLFFGVFMFFMTSQLNASAKAQIPSYFVEQYFTGVSAYPVGWGAGTALWGGNAAINWTTPAPNQLNFSGSGSGTRGFTVNYPTSGTEANVFMDFDFFITAAVLGQRNAWGLMIDDSNNQLVYCIYAAGNDGKFHVWNQNKDTAAFVGGSFNKASAVDIAGTNKMNETTRVNLTYATGVWFNVKAALDFTRKQIVSLKIQNKTSLEEVTLTNLPMVNLTATNVSKISLTNTRSSIAGNGNNANLNTSIDNFKTYKMVEVETDIVTITYKDGLGNEVKPQRVQADLEIGSTYTATESDKATFNDGSFYYTYDAAATLADNVVVASGGTSVINLVFKKTPFTSGIYKWTGAANGKWSNEDFNFTTDDINSLGYQPGNGVLFPSVGANKTINLADIFNIGANNMEITGSNYNISGVGAINGSGALNINLGASDVLTLNVTNNLTGGTRITGGNVTVSKTGALSNGVTVSGNSVITYGAAAVTIPATNFLSSTSIVAGAVNSSLISGMTAGAGVKITVSAGMNHAGTDTSRAFDFAPNGTLSAGSELEFNGTGTDNRIGMTSASTSYLENTKLNLKGATMLYINSSQSAATTINVGSLSGEAGTRLGWGRSSDLTRTITWSVGALNENSEFAGSITNTGGYNSGGNSWIGNATHFIKEGTGTLTMSGTANTHNGNFTINNGTLNVTGVIGNATSLINVGPSGNLKGTGTIGGATTVNGSIEGRLNFGGTLSLNGTTKFVVNGTNVGEFDVINVTGNVNLGGAVDVVVNQPAGIMGINKAKNSTPIGTTIKLINAANIITSLPVIHFSASGWTFKPSTGELIYDPNNVISGIGNNNIAFNIYPTLTRDFVNVEGNIKTIDVFSLTGQKVKSLVANGAKTVVNLSNLTSGAYIIRANMEDGSANMQNVILQK